MMGALVPVLYEGAETSNFLHAPVLATSADGQVKNLPQNLFFIDSRGGGGGEFFFPPPPPIPGILIVAIILTIMKMVAFYGLFTTNRNLNASPDAVILRIESLNT